MAVFFVEKYTCNLVKKLQKYKKNLKKPKLLYKITSIGNIYQKYLKTSPYDL